MEYVTYLAIYDFWSIVYIEQAIQHIFHIVKMSSAKGRPFRRCINYLMVKTPIRTLLLLPKSIKPYWNEAICMHMIVSEAASWKKLHEVNYSKTCL